jgi:DNA (cytosine-5)-methyltransferase 1
MNELSLFTGAGGGLLGTHLLGWKAIGYVEWNEYCQRVIRARIDDGILPVAPIFTDVREFVQSGAAAEYRGFADVVSGGFPCQPFSVAGKQLGAADPRNMWPATIAVIRAVRPRFAFLENVPAILSSGYFGTILGDLAESGYDCRWRILSAGEMGAPHLRNRLWIVAYADSRRLLECDQSQRTISKFDTNADVAYPHGTGRLQQWQPVTNENEYSAIECSCGESIESLRNKADVPKPIICGVDDGMAYRVDRLKAIGNGQVPSVAAAAWQLLTGDV